MNFGYEFNCCIFITIYSVILILGKHGITSQSNIRQEFHRLKNSSYYVLISEGPGDKLIKSRTTNYMIRQNGQVKNDDDVLPHTHVKSSKFGIDKIRPWLKTDEKSIADNAMAESQVMPKKHSRTPQVSIGTHSASTSLVNNLSMSKCGIYTSKYIVGGRQAPEGAHPWIVALMVSGKMWCSGTIINEWWVVTAAHAFEHIGTDPEKVTISVGSTDRTKGKIYKVEKIIVHERYDANKFKESDIAVMRIAGPVVMGPNVIPICLPEMSYQDVKSSSLVVAGWGFLEYGVSDSPIQLRQVQLNVLPLARCSQIYSRIKYKIYRSQICTHNEKQDACQGDSGGPAVEYINGRGTLVGVVSYGVTCADKYPGVFTKVSFYINWIQNAISNS